MAKRTTEQSKRTVRVLAIGGTVIATAGVGIAFASNPHPKSTQLPDAHLTALQQRENALVQQAKVVNEEHKAVWNEYHVALAERQREINDVNNWNGEVRASLARTAAAARAAQAQAAAAQAAASSSSSSAPSAGYTYSPPVVSSGSS